MGFRHWSDRRQMAHGGVWILGRSVQMVVSGDTVDDQLSALGQYMLSL